MKITGIPIALMAHVFICGCYLPSPVAQTPEIRGVVSDKASKRPIGGVLAYYKEYPSSVSRTMSNGHFLLREIKDWKLVSIGAKSVPDASGTLVLEDPRYGREELEVKGNGGWPVEMTIELARPE